MRLALPVSHSTNTLRNVHFWDASVRTEKVKTASSPHFRPAYRCAAGRMTRNLCFTDCWPGKAEDHVQGRLPADAPHPSEAVQPSGRDRRPRGAVRRFALPLDASCAAVCPEAVPAAATGVGLPGRDGLRRHDNGQRTGRQQPARAGRRSSSTASAAARWPVPRNCGCTCAGLLASRNWSARSSTRCPAGRTVSRRTRCPLMCLPKRMRAAGACGWSHGLSQGHWGHHLTRARLGGWKVPGKAVWFAQPVPPGTALDRFPGRCPAPAGGRHAGADAGRSRPRAHRAGRRAGLGHVRAVHPARPDRVGAAAGWCPGPAVPGAASGGRSPTWWTRPSRSSARTRRLDRPRTPGR